MMGSYQDKLSGTGKREPMLEASPRDHGSVVMLCIRPAVDERTELPEAELTPEAGMVGDRWASTCKRRGPDGAPLRDVQLTLMSTRVLQAIEAPRPRWSLAGDQVYVDLDLGEENLPVGTRLRLGTAEVEITAEPHLGCRKFAQRFGQDAVRFVSSELTQRRRGVYARVTRPGTVRVGDRVVKI